MLIVGHATHVPLRPPDGTVSVGGIELPYRKRRGETDEQAAARTVAAYVHNPDDVVVLTSGAG